MARLVRPLLVSLLALLVVLSPGAALAHDELIGSDPAAGETVSPPEELTLRFSGSIADVGAQVMVTGEDGSSVLAGEPQVQGTELVQPLVDEVPGGDYEVVWRVTSSDGHPISGTFRFSVDAPAPAQETEEATDEAATEEATEDVTEEATEQETQEPTTPAATAEETTPAGTPATDQSQEAGTAGGGVPVWAWVVVGLAGLALLGLLARTWARGRS